MQAFSTSEIELGSLKILWETKRQQNTRPCEGIPRGPLTNIEGAITKTDIKRPNSESTIKVAGSRNIYFQTEFFCGGFGSDGATLVELWGSRVDIPILFLRNLLFKK